jgi:hypothetical protein
MSHAEEKLSEQLAAVTLTPNIRISSSPSALIGEVYINVFHVLQ